MRKNLKRVSDLKQEMVQEIKALLIKIDFAGRLTFNRGLALQVQVKSVLDYDWGTEARIGRYMTIDGFVVDEEEDEIGVDELNPYELAFILDELEDGNYSIEPEDEI